MKGQLIVLEGIDGCGKTTQINLLSTWLKKSGLIANNSELVITREPGGTALGNALRGLLLEPPGCKAPEAITELLLYAADRAQHIAQMIKPALKKGDWVISDRFSGSTIAYQGYGRNLDIETIKQLEAIATQGLKPDITFWLNVDVKESIQRRVGKVDDRIEAEGENFLKNVSNGFATIAKERNWIEIQANLKKDLICKEIQNRIMEHYELFKE